MDGLSLSEAALLYAENGFKIIPLKPNSKEPIFKGGNEWRDLATCDVKQVAAWWEEYPNANIGLPLGVNNLAAIDYDPKDGADENFPNCLPRTYTTATPTGGLHPIFRLNGHADKFTSSVKKLAPGISIRLKGFYVVLPPSIHPETNWPYLTDVPLWKSEIIDLPDWMAEAPEIKEIKPIRSSGKNCQVEGGRNNYLTSIAGTLRRKGVSEEAVKFTLLYENKNNCMPPLPESEVLAIAKSAMRWEQKENIDYQKLFSGYPDEHPKTGKKFPTIANVSEMFKRLGIVVRYNVIAKEQEILIPNKTFSIDNRANVSYAHIIDWCTCVGIPTKDLMGQITAIAEENLYNPVATWIESKPWDGISRIEDFCDTVSSTDSLKNKLMTTWMIQAVAAAFEPNGIAASGVLVFQGKQYIGKTQWFKNLCPQEFRADGMTLSPSDKDSVLQVVSKWIVELGELDATFKKSDIAQLKAFITKEHDSLRPAYARAKSDYGRRTTFFASVNEADFLGDPTGNRRFWTVQCDHINFNHGLDMQQVWAEFLTLYRAGQSRFLTHEDIQELNQHNENFQVSDSIWEELRNNYDWAATNRRELTCTQIAKELGYERPDKGILNRIGRAVRKLSGVEKPRWIDGNKLFPIPYVASKGYHPTDTSLFD